jgi:2-dehydro-3-deoxyphosphooctonate aldolase (KDO 8-P synthase)
MATRKIRMGNVHLGADLPLVFICGPCVCEDRTMAMDYAARLAGLSEKHQVPMVFKASYDKANRTSIDSYRGPGAEKALPFLREAAETAGLPLLVDVHTPDQVPLASEMADVLQVPAFLSRQTDLLVACGKSGRAVNVKKGQFLAPADMRHAVAKLESTGATDISLTERGTSFGYHNLVVDMRGLPIMAATGYPVIFDATHSVQLPGAGDGQSGGQREYVATLARAATAVGVDGIYAEVHADPAQAKSDGPNALTFEMLDDLIASLKAIDALVRGHSTGSGNDTLESAS